MSARAAGFRLDLDQLAALVAAIGEERGVERPSLTDCAGTWLHEQLADLIDRAQRADHQVIVVPWLSGHPVGIVAYTDEDGLILALRYDPLFYRHGAQIDGGWDEPSAYLPMREDGSDVDLEDLAGILEAVVDRANALLPVLAAAVRVRFAALRFTHRPNPTIDRKAQP